ncbi:acetyl esterase [Rathayibacter tritici]|uniref:alpha/beta hydrolase n=1 Tax=Rathayibacter tritici TaxID=33888 RepID=UPI000CE8F1FC|nr:alpha/beta hydrolase [Rathayibacter tritici]PPF26821.1 acetyl esterase [Rathayibacter tritici]PPF69801.1 acetyl esterase [Rathayibacter tritici]PPG09167.1 acetyl esterase [Rathayibacter tritici]PPI18127.1 acetyl esterase [Rathayibacter tritici]
MPLDPYLAARLPLLDGLAYPLDAEQAARMAAFEEDPGPWSLPGGIVVSTEVAAGPHGPVPLRVYSPTAPERALLWVHGGGFAAGSIDMRESHVVAGELAARAQAHVASVDYRLAGADIRYPVPLDDVHAAWRHLRGRTREAQPVAIGGASAGAALALGAVLRERDSGACLPDHVLLAYPFAHFPTPSLDDAVAAELRLLPPILRFPPSSIESMVRTYIGRISDLPAEALPGSAPLAGLPPVTVLVNECDELRGSAELLLRQLAEAGVAVTGHLAAGMPHGHLNRTPALLEVDRSLHLFAAQLRAMG